MFNQLKIFNQREKQEVLKKLNEQFGISELKGVVSSTGKERLFLFQGNFDEKQIEDFEKIMPLERLGVYFAKIVEGEDLIKLSMEGVHIFKNQITKNIFELENELDAENWMKGQDLQIKTGMKGFVVVKFKDYFLGCGKASEEKIGNFIPKSRRLREKTG